MTVRIARLFVLLAFVAVVGCGKNTPAPPPPPAPPAGGTPPPTTGTKSALPPNRGAGVTPTAPDVQFTLPNLSTADKIMCAVSGDGGVVGVYGHDPALVGKADPGGAWLFWDVAKKQEAGPRLKMPFPVQLSPDGKTAFYRNVYKLTVRDVASGKESVPYQVSGVLDPVVFAPAGDFAIAFQAKGPTRVELPSGKASPPGPKPPGKVTRVSNIFARGTRIAGLQSDGKVVVLDTASGKVVDTLDAGPRAAKGNVPVTVSEDGRFLVADENAVWDLPGKKEAWSVTDQFGLVDLTAYPVGGLVLFREVAIDLEVRTSGATESLLLADATTGKVRQRLLVPPEFTNEVMRPVVSADGTAIVTVSRKQNTVLVWRPKLKE